MVTRNTRTFIRIILIVLALVAIAGYSLFQARHLIAGPILEIHTPHTGERFEDSFIEIVGNATNISYISLNGREIFIDQEGRFSEKLILMEGYNIMTLMARDRFGRTVSKKIELVHSPLITS